MKKLSNIKTPSAVNAIIDSIRNSAIKAVALGGILMTPSVSYAAMVESDGVTGGLGIILGYACSIFALVGIVLLIYGIISLITAIRNEDGDRQQKAVVNIGVGLAVAANKVIITAVLDAMSISIDIGDGFFG